MKTIFALLMIFSPFLAVNSRACSCSSSPPVYARFKGHSVVFTGKVLGSKDLEIKHIDADDETKNWTETERIFQFEVIEVFKGLKTKKVDVNVGSVGSSCYKGFAVGERYLIYADLEDDKSVSHGFCTPSKNLDGAGDQIYFIREFLKGKPESQIYGSVNRSDTFPNTIKTRLSPLESIKIILQGKQKNFETTTDKNGFFKFNGIPDGDYALLPETPLIYRTYFPDSERIRIQGGKVFGDYDGSGFNEGYNAFYTKFTLGWKNSVEGNVIDAEGKTVKFAAVRLLPVSLPFEKIYSDYTSDKFDIGEKYLCSGETPGKYYLVAEVYAPFENKDKVRFFYPQAETPDKASIISLGATDELNFDFILPAKYVIREIRGTVVWSDGKPVEDASVALYRTENHQKDDEKDDIENHGYDSGRADSQGHFVLRGFENAEYWLHVAGNFEIPEDEEAEDIEVKARPIKIKIQKTMEPLKIILTKP